uniref:Uncharacterized protein n=1 Tax=Siphoviridae sp. ctKvA22 TaxID=2826246 RepID=A0A8S5MAD6_9CAUD|nr:MAG TPA: hypothetical protein [Siphoviridae sp. ctKvA22]
MKMVTRKAMKLVILKAMTVEVIVMKMAITKATKKAMKQPKRNPTV